MDKILIIITGSIAASKCKDLIKLLYLKKIKISCVLTNEAKKYIKINDIKKHAGNRIYTDDSEKKNKMLI